MPIRHATVSVYLVGAHRNQDVRICTCTAEPHAQEVATLLQTAHSGRAYAWTDMDGNLHDVQPVRLQRGEPDPRD